LAPRTLTHNPRSIALTILRLSPPTSLEDGVCWKAIAWVSVIHEYGLTNQRDVVRNERRKWESAPYGLVDEELYHQLFPQTHPYHADVMALMRH